MKANIITQTFLRGEERTVGKYQSRAFSLLFSDVFEIIRRLPRLSTVSRGFRKLPHGILIDVKKGQSQQRFLPTGGGRFTFVANRAVSVNARISQRHAILAAPVLIPFHIARIVEIDALACASE